MSKINNQLSAFLQDLAATVDFSLDFNEITIDNVLKCCGVKPALAYQSLLEKIICYVNMFVELKGIYVFVFVGLKDILNDEEITLLYRHCQLIKVCLLLVESFQKHPLLPCERAVVITEDLCEITHNFSQEMS